MADSAPEQNDSTAQRGRAVLESGNFLLFTDLLEQHKVRYSDELDSLPQRPALRFPLDWRRIWTRLTVTLANTSPRNRRSRDCKTPPAPRVKRTEGRLARVQKGVV